MYHARSLCAPFYLAPCFMSIAMQLLCLCLFAASRGVTPYCMELMTGVFISGNAWTSQSQHNVSRRVADSSCNPHAQVKRASIKVEERKQAFRYIWIYMKPIYVKLTLKTAVTHAMRFLSKFWLANIAGISCTVLSSMLKTRPWHPSPLLSPLKNFVQARLYL